MEIALEDVLSGHQYNPPTVEQLGVWMAGPPTLILLKLIHAEQGRAKQARTNEGRTAKTRPTPWLISMSGMLEKNYLLNFVIES